MVMCLSRSACRFARGEYARSPVDEFGRLRGRPGPGVATRTCSSSGISCQVSAACPGVIRDARYRPPSSARVWIFACLRLPDGQALLAAPAACWSVRTTVASTWASQSMLRALRNLVRPPGLSAVLIIVSDSLGTK